MLHWFPWFFLRMRGPLLYKGSLVRLENPEPESTHSHCLHIHRFWMERSGERKGWKQGWRWICVGNLFKIKGSSMQLDVSSAAYPEDFLEGRVINTPF